MSAIKTLQQKLIDLDVAVDETKKRLAHYHTEIERLEEEHDRLVREKNEHLAAIDRLETKA